MPLLSVVADPHTAVIVALTLATLTNSYQAWSGRHDADRGVAGRMLAGATVGLPIGLLVFLSANDRVLGAVIGIAVLVAVVVIARGLDLRHAGPGLDVGGGVLSGALTMSAGVNGPPLVFVLQARHFDQQRFRGTITTVFMVLDIVSVVVFAVAGEYDRDVLIAVAVALPALAVGARAGIALRRHLDARRFRRLVLTLLDRRRHLRARRRRCGLTARTSSATARATTGGTRSCCGGSRPSTRSAAASSGGPGRRPCRRGGRRVVAGCRTSARCRCRGGRCGRSPRGTACRRRSGGRRRGSTGCLACDPVCARARSTPHRRRRGRRAHGRRARSRRRRSCGRPTAPRRAARGRARRPAPAGASTPSIVRPIIEPPTWSGW